MNKDPETQNHISVADRFSGGDHLEEDEVWSAVLTRNAAFDGLVVYAVRSTHIYCRPSCASRRPNRSQVVFFPIPEAAEQAGFRPCRRCLPHLHSPTDPNLEMVRGICREISDSPDGPPTLAELGAKLGFSPFHVQRVFKRVMGISPRQYADACRIDTLKTNLKNGRNVTDALYEAGYGSSSRLYEQSQTQLRMTPATYRNGGQGVQVAYTISECFLGRVLVAATDRGICAIQLGVDADSLESGLAKEYPNARLERGDGPLQEWVDGVLARMDGQPAGQALPLDIRATAFQRRVWQHLTTIPRGETRTYSQVAQALGEPRSARAVANACAANPVALVVPCHRVVRQDRGLGGYRWGLERKAALLERESSTDGPLQEQNPGAQAPVTPVSLP